MLKIAMLYAVVFALFQSPLSHAANYTAVGILTTYNKQMNYFKTEFVQIPGFKSAEDCDAAIGKETGSDDYIGVGGTNGKVPGLQWNFDANCMKVNDE
jgi:hypothetical protein